MSRNLDLIQAILRYIHEADLPDSQQRAEVVYWDDPETRRHLAMLVDEYMVKSAVPMTAPHLRTESLDLRVEGYTFMRDMEHALVWRTVLKHAGASIDRLSLKQLSDMAFRISSAPGHRDAN